MYNAESVNKRRPVTTSSVFTFRTKHSSNRKVVNMTGRQISYQVRSLIIKDCKRGVSQRKIAQKYEVSAVQKLYKKFLNTGTVIEEGSLEKVERGAQLGVMMQTSYEW